MAASDRIGVYPGTFDLILNSHRHHPALVTSSIA